MMSQGFPTVTPRIHHVTFVTYDICHIYLNLMIVCYNLFAKSDPCGLCIFQAYAKERGKYGIQNC